MYSLLTGEMIWETTAVKLRGERRRFISRGEGKQKLTTYTNFARRSITKKDCSLNHFYCNILN